MYLRRAIARHWGMTLALAGVAGCASARPVAVPVGANVATGATASAAYCVECSEAPVDSQLATAVEKRISDLKSRGGHCSSYAAVLERSLRNGQIMVRPYMWRVGSQLASGEARPNGEMVLAREIDSLNVGLRTVDDVLWSMEHEAAHLAFHITNGVDSASDRANEYVRACRAGREQLSKSGPRH